MVNGWIDGWMNQWKIRPKTYLKDDFEILTVSLSFDGEIKGKLNTWMDCWKNRPSDKYIFGCFSELQ